MLLKVVLVRLHLEVVEVQNLTVFLDLNPSAAQEDVFAHGAVMSQLIFVSLLAKLLFAKIIRNKSSPKKVKIINSKN